MSINSSDAMMSPTAELLPPEEQAFLRIQDARDSAIRNALSVKNILTVETEKQDKNVTDLLKFYEETLGQNSLEVKYKIHEKRDDPASKEMGTIIVSVGMTDILATLDPEDAVDCFPSLQEKLKTQGLILEQDQYHHVIRNSEGKEIFTILLDRETGEIFVSALNSSGSTYQEVISTVYRSIFGKTETTLRKALDGITSETRELITKDKIDTKSLEEVGKFLEDPDIRKKLDDDTRKAVTTVFSQIKDPQEQKKALEILEESTPHLLLELSKSMGTDPSLIQMVKNIYLMEADKMVMSRQINYMNDQEESWEISQIMKGEFGIPVKVYGAMIVKDRGEKRKGDSDNSIYLHYSDSVSLRCRFYTSDVDHPSQGQMDQNILYHFISFTDAKIFQASLEANERKWYKETKGVELTPEVCERENFPSRYMEGRVTNPTQVGLNELSEIVMSRKWKGKSDFSPGAIPFLATKIRYV